MKLIAVTDEDWRFLAMQKFLHTDGSIAKTLTRALKPSTDFDVVAGIVDTCIREWMTRAGGGYIDPATFETQFVIPLIREVLDVKEAQQ